MGIFDIFKKSKESAKAEVNPLMDSLISAGFEIEDLNVTNIDGEVVVTGFVNQGEGVKNIANFLQRSPGVKKVVNRIVVKDISDQGLKYRVETKVRYLNVRKGASTDHAIVGKLEKGAEVLLVKKENDSWFLVKGTDIEGYCNSEYLRPI